MSIKAKRSEKQSGKNKRKKRNRHSGRYNRGQDEKTAKWRRENTQSLFKIVFFFLKGLPNSSANKRTSKMCRKSSFEHVISDPIICPFLFWVFTAHPHTQTYTHTRLQLLQFGFFSRRRMIIPQPLWQSINHYIHVQVVSQSSSFFSCENLLFMVL